jgi:uncharacterized membrane protein (UPF0182 family)
VSFDAPPPPTASQAPKSQRPSPRRRGALLLTIAILIVLFFAFTLFASYYTDWLWYKSVNISSVYTTQLWVRLAMFVGCFAIAFAAIVVNAFVAYRFRPIFRAISLEQQSLDRYRLALDPFRRILLIGFGALVGFFFGAAAMSEWRTALAWANRTAFGQTDPQFHVDISFYVFSLPWWRFLVDSAMVLVLLCGLVAAAIHYLYGGISPASTGERTTRAARVQLSILIGLFVLLKAVAYWLDRYELVITPNSLFTGAGYTDVNALIPAKTILTVVALICAGLFFVNVFRTSWRLAVLSLGLLVLSALAIGWIYPTFVQRLTVNPTQDVKEAPFIERNIEATRAAYGLDSIQEDDYDPVSTPDAGSFKESRGTLENVRLMDPARLSQTFDQLQQVKGFYTFQDPLDVDRYTIDGRQADVIAAPREIDLSGVPAEQRNWINDHLTYTHGYGLVAAYSNRANANGEPDFAEFDLPPQGVLDIKQPRIYFGEKTPTYSIVGAPASEQPRELDYPDDTETNGQRSFTYDGHGGVPVGSFFNRLLYAWRFQETNILLSDRINSESQILYIRDPRDRVERAAPWLTLDSDPYATVVDGRIVWIVDGYTTSDAYPYSQRQEFGQATTDSLTSQAGTPVVAVRDQINYLRNSVKATVDAYDGTVTLYAWDESDPVLQTWSKAIPGTVQPRSAISEDLLAHVRYPEDQFKVQREVFTRYHVTDPQIFYGSQDVWKVPIDPTSPSSGDISQPPYYLTLQMPGDTEPKFSLTTTFAPFDRETLAAFMSVNSDATDPHYGQIRALKLPRNTTFPGPAQMQNNIESNQTVANALLSLRRGGSSEVELGNLLTLPVADGLMYVEPVYARSTQADASYPTLRKVIVSFGESVAIADTYGEALSRFFDGVDIDGTQTGGKPGGNGGKPDGKPGGNGNGSNQNLDAQQRLQQALSDASAAYQAGQDALAAGDFAAYGQAQQDLLAALQRAQQAADELGVKVPSVGSDSGSGSGSGA